MSKFNAIETARRVIKVESEGLSALSKILNKSFEETTALVKDISGHVVLTGVGKSGHVARKISATFASTGTPSLFVHPTEASHGDMGMITKNDCVIALSRSGETKELADITRYCKRFSVPLIAMTCIKSSTLAKASDYLLLLPDSPEACNVTGAPTTSTTLQIALGDALAVALLDARGFTAGDFKTFHPGGSLGAQLTSVRDLMRKGEAMPLCAMNESMATALGILSTKNFGCVGITDANDALIGMITDGDIRRHLGENILAMRPEDLMTKAPKIVNPDMLAEQALHFMTAKKPKVTQVFALEDGKPVGILHLHDLLRAGLA
ncbi:MAG: KpsF/GutQ family sugar-phosphate isomerase [Robiginitomaculum sp.]